MQKNVFKKNLNNRKTASLSQFSDFQKNATKYMCSNLNLFKTLIKLTKTQFYRLYLMNTICIYKYIFN